MTISREGLIPTRFMLGCAPVGKFTRAINDFVHVKRMPGWTLPWGIISVIIAASFWGAFLSKDSVAVGSGVGWGIVACLVPFLLVLLFWLAKPTHILVTKDGVSYCWKHTIEIYGPTLRWKELEHISVVQPEYTSRIQSRLLRFSGGGKNVDLKLDEVTELDLLPVLFDAIVSKAPNVPRDAELQSMLGSDKVNTSYTELWLKALTAPPERSRLAPLAEGTTLQGGEYKIVEAIGAGGQGVAYTAYKKSGENTGTVVLKEYILPVGVSHSNKVESLEKFQREAQILGQIDHPQIVKLIDFFFEDHRGYMVLEYIQGINLQLIVGQQGALKEPEVIDLALQMASILSHLHSREPAIIHRDFTPDNLILTSSGVLKLIDFNVAHQKKTSATATVVGKHAYISPDQFRGQVTPQSDIYSLGASLYFLLTGTEPKPISESHPKQKNDYVSEEMDKIVSTCTAVESHARFESADQLAEAIKKLKEQSLV